MITLQEFRELTKELKGDTTISFSFVHSLDYTRIGFDADNLKIDKENNRIVLELDDSSTEDTPTWTEEDEEEEEENNDDNE